MDKLAIQILSYILVITAAYVIGYFIGKSVGKEEPSGNLMIQYDEDGEYLYLEFPNKEALAVAKKRRRITLDVVVVAPKEKQSL